MKHTINFDDIEDVQRLRPGFNTLTLPGKTRNFGLLVGDQLEFTYNGKPFNQAIINCMEVVQDINHLSSVIINSNYKFRSREAIYNNLARGYPQMTTLTSIIIVGFDYAPN